MKIGTLAFVILFSLIACDKDEKETVKPVQEDKMVAMRIEVTSVTGRNEKGIIIGEESKLIEAFEQNEAEIQLIKESRRNNIFSIAPDQEIGDVFDPDACMSEIYSIYDMYYDTWLQEANENCEDKVVCITCPGEGAEMYAMFFINPTSIDCNVYEIAYEFVRFPFIPNDYESDEVTSYINKL